MARKHGKHYYDPGQLKLLEGIPLPDKIKCARCAKFVSQKKFSSTQLAHARTEIKNRGNHATYKINCMTCTGGQVVEIKCTSCNKTKGLEDFAKSQRRNLDTATCYDCVEEQLDVDPINDEVYDEIQDRSNAFVPDDVPFDYQPSQWTDDDKPEGSSSAGWNDDDEEGGIHLGSDFRTKLSLGSSSQRGTLISTEDEPESQKDENDGWQTQRSKSKASAKASSSTTPRFDPNKYGKPAAPSSGSLKTWSSGYAEKPGSTTARKNGWAKIKAYNPKSDGPSFPDSKQQNDVADDDWSSSESDDDNDDDDSDDGTVI